MALLECRRCSREVRRRHQRLGALNTSTAGVQNPTDLYWRNLPDYRKRIVVNELVQHPIRGFVQTASCRPNPQGLAFLFPSRL